MNDPGMYGSGGWDSVSPITGEMTEMGGIGSPQYQHPMASAMSGWGGSAMGGIASGIGSIAGAGIQGAIAEAINAKQIELAREQMAFQERMSSSAYQRATADMKAAGINPMVAYQQGGASSPMGAQASLNVPDVGRNIGDAIKNGLGTAMEMQRVDRELKQADSQIVLNAATAANQTQNAVVGQATAKNIQTDTKVKTLEAQKRGLEIPTVKSEAELGKAKADTEKGFVKYDAITDRIFKLLNEGASAFMNFRRGGAAGTPPLTPAQKDYVNKTNNMSKRLKGK